MSGAVTAVAAGVGASALGASALAATAIGAGVGVMGHQQSQAAKQANKAQEAQVRAQRDQVAVQRQAQADAVSAAEKQQSASQQNTNRANQRRPDTQSIMSSAQQASKSGPAGTMLTGNQGVQKQDLELGKNTLLGS